MARSMKNTQAEAQIDNTATATQNSDWGKYQRRAIRSFMKRAKAHHLTFTMTIQDGEPITMGVREMNSLFRSVGIMTLQQRDLAEGTLTTEETAEKHDTTFGYFTSDGDDFTRDV